MEHVKGWDCYNVLFEILPYSVETPGMTFSIQKLYELIYGFDLSQEAIEVSLLFDSIRNNYIMIDTIAIPFEEYPDFSYLFPKPDSIGEKIIFYTKPCKIEQLKSEGFHAFVKYPEKQGEQTARIFVMTMILSLLLTGIINQTIRIIKEAKIEKKFSDKTKSCAISVLNCNDCPLKSQCEHLRDDQQLI